MGQHPPDPGAIADCRELVKKIEEVDRKRVELTGQLSELRLAGGDHDSIDDLEKHIRALTDHRADICIAIHWRMRHFKAELLESCIGQPVLVRGYFGISVRGTLIELWRSSYCAVALDEGQEFWELEPQCENFKCQTCEQRYLRFCGGCDPHLHEDYPDGLWVGELHHVIPADRKHDAELTIPADPLG